MRCTPSITQSSDRLIVLSALAEAPMPLKIVPETVPDHPPKSPLARVTALPDLEVSLTASFSVVTPRATTMSLIVCWLLDLSWSKRLPDVSRNMSSGRIIFQPSVSRQPLGELP